VRIELITAWYNEAFLAPFFLNHYRFVDRIHILLESTSTDDTMKICEKYSNVQVELMTSPGDQLDDIIKVDMINSIYKNLDCDWVLAPDADEFIFPLPFGKEFRSALEKEDRYKIVYSRMWQVYRHSSDKDLDPDLPSVPQRRHGDPDTVTGGNSGYTKPIIIRAGLPIELCTGMHSYRMSRNKYVNKICKLLNYPAVSPRFFGGVHWAHADSKIALLRRIRSRNRQSQVNIINNFGSHNYDITEEKIKNRCDSHIDDPLLF